MSWFVPKLEPGEAIILRNPALRDPWGVVLLATSVMAFMTLILQSDHVQTNPPPGLSSIWLFLGGIFGLTVGTVFLSRATKAGWAITDRRVLAWRGVLRKEVMELRRHEIDETALNADDLMVRGVGGRLWLNLKGIRDDALQSALGDIAPPAGLKTASLNRILEQGETVIWRHRAFWNWRFPAAPWSAAVTDRRILLRRLHDRTRYDSIPLGSIKEIEAPHEGSHRVYLHANGQRLEFRPGNLPAAERMHEAIKTATKGTA